MKQRKQTKHREKPITLYPLKPEEALAAFMQIDKQRLLRAEKEKGQVDSWPGS